MASTTSPDAEGSEDVNDFLLRIRELGEKRDKEDEERTKKLEEEILQGRRERQARRLERARSISPSKDSPLLDPARWSMPSYNQRAINPPEKLAPTPQTPDRDTTNKPDLAQLRESIVADSGRRGSQAEPTDTTGSPRPTTPSLRSRTGTLSWQQRPASRDFNNPNRLSFSASPTREGRFSRTMSITSNDDRGFSQSPGTRSPVAKETVPLRPTGREESSPSPTRLARPKTEEDDAPTHDSKSKVVKADKAITIEPEKEISPTEIGEDHSQSQSRASSTFADSSLGNRYSSVSSVSTATGLRSPVRLSNTPKFEPPAPEPVSDEQATSPTSPRRLSPERSTSPTKGLGGFVQSAMMKRSDSVSKRWSAQLPSGLMRGNSFASNRNSFAAPTNGDVFSPPSPTRLSRSGTLSSQRPTSSHRPASSHRPSSSHSDASFAYDKENERPVTPTVPGSENNNLEGVTRPPITHHARSTSALGNEVKAESPMSTSPVVSRTMDPKRWSPTKSTWLESALNRPESPRHKRQPSQQSSWARERQTRGSVDFGRVNSFKEVTPVGLMRTAGPGSHSKTSSVSGIPDIFGTPDTNKAKEEPPESDLTIHEDDVSPAENGKPEDQDKDIGQPSDETVVEKAEDDQREKEPEREIEKENEKVEEQEGTTRKRAPSLLAPSPKTPVEAPLASPLKSPRDPLLDRPKPQSPVIDFRANLRKREVVKDQGNREEPEFKNVFGRLRKAETSNYVAPDQLKDNILRGKAALAVTGGPKKTQRVDELKESILKQKEAIKASGGSLRRNTVGDDDAPTNTVPEAIAKRQNLTKSSSAQSNFSSPSPQEPGTPRASQDQWNPISSQGYERVDHSSSPHIASVEASISGGDPKDLPADPFVSEGGIQSKQNEAQEAPGFAEPEGQNKESLMETLEPVRAPPSESVVQDAKPATTEGLATKGKLAGRINPALAGLLSRGPPAPVDSSKSASSTITSKQNDTKPAGPLTHMTKGRAKGPKRRPPKVAATETPEHVSEEHVSQEQSTVYPDDQERERSPSPIEYPVNSSNWPLPDGDIVPPVTSDMGSCEPAQPAPPQPAEFVRSISPAPVTDTEKTNEIDSPPTAAPTTTAVPTTSSPPETKTFEDVENLEDSPSSKPAPPPKSTPIASTPNRPSQGRNSQLYYSSPSPSPLRTSFRENQVHPSPSTHWKNTLGVATPSSVGSSSGEKALPSPPVPPKFNIAVEQPSSPRSSGSLVPQADESLEAISGFFRTFPKSSDRVEIDTQLMLMGKNNNPKIRTLKKQIWEITGDGMKQDLPTHHEYILYEGSMYLCVHLFEFDGNVRAEAHLWCGDGVPDSAIDDAQSFSKKVAKDNGCKLEIIKQGKETANFIQALGGILITRRGFSSRSSSSAFFMLCGRKHLGQMVFDEVDFSRRGLCSGYPFVISAMFGKLYLWKGKGSAAEEIGAARLIGMDLGLTGEFEEVAEGEEPASFFEVFTHDGEVGDYMNADDWPSKPNYENFRLRLLRVDHELGQRSGFWLRRSGSSSPVIRPNDTVQEVEPFCQQDITTRGIYVLDTFFEIYVIVGEHASSRSAEFASAVIFAHEYGILAASLQDRPFIPKSFVSLGGIPDSCRSVFRKWRPRTSRMPPQVFPLDAAIDAIRS